MKMAMGVSFAQLILGTGAAVLAIIGLAKVFPVILLSIATIIVGAGFLFEAGSIAERYSSVASWTQAKGWMTVEFVAGTAGIAMGILALLHVVPMILVPIAAMILGIALVVDSGVSIRLNGLERAKSKAEGSHLEMARKAVSYTAGIQGLVGLFASALGLIALLGLNPVILSLIAVLGIGAANLVNGEATSRVLSLLLLGEPKEVEK